MSETKPNQPPAEREFTPAEKKLLDRLAQATESPYPLVETAAQRTAAEAELRAELKAGCGARCPKTLPAVAEAVLGELADDAGKPTGLVHVQLAAGCTGCGRRRTRDYLVKV